MEINADLPERFRGNRRSLRPRSSAGSGESGLVIRLNPFIQRYIIEQENVRPENRSERWLSTSEVPYGDEICLPDDIEVKLPPNKINSPWDSVGKYLKFHYKLLREDTTSPLRSAIDAFKKNPRMNDDSNISIYEKACPHSSLK